MGHSRWRALRGGHLADSVSGASTEDPAAQLGLRDETAQAISSPDLNPAEAAVCKSRKGPAAVRQGNPGLPCRPAWLRCGAQAHKRAEKRCSGRDYVLHLPAVVLVVHTPLVVAKPTSKACWEQKTSTRQAGCCDTKCGVCSRSILLSAMSGTATARYVGGSIAEGLPGRRRHMSGFGRRRRNFHRLNTLVRSFVQRCCCILLAAAADWAPDLR